MVRGARLEFRCLAAQILCIVRRLVCISICKLKVVICILSFRYLAVFLEVTLISVLIVECIDCCSRILCLDLYPVESSNNVIVERHLTQSIRNARMRSLLTNLLGNLLPDFRSFEIDENVTCSTPAARILFQISKLVVRMW